MNKLWGGAIAIGAAWFVVKIGLLDLVVGGILGDLAAELDRLSGPLAGLLVAVSVPAALVGLGLVLSKKHRGIGVELMIVSALLVFGAKMLPVAGHWASGEATVMSASMSHAAPVAPAPVQAAGR
jgi:hypothetical protein